MPITIEIIDSDFPPKIFDEVFSYFEYVDQKFSTYKPDSEISQINIGKIRPGKYSNDMKHIFDLAEQTKQETNGYFNIKNNGLFDPSGIVKGWAINNAVKLLVKRGIKNFYVDAGGDIQTKGKNSKGEMWSIGIKNPFNQTEIVKVLTIDNVGVATSGTYIRGQHIYNPITNKPASAIVSLTVIGPDIYEADRFATAAFAMEEVGINFIENLSGFEGYMINHKGIAYYTNGFDKYVKQI